MFIVKLFIFGYQEVYEARVIEHVKISPVSVYSLETGDMAKPVMAPTTLRVFRLCFHFIYTLGNILEG